MNNRNFFAELRRRNVYKVAVAYIVAGWALSQGIAQVFPVFDIPNWIIRALVVLTIAGLPVALVLAWMFEITPQGIKRTETADALPASARGKKYGWVYVVIIGVAVSIGLFSLGRYTASTPRQSEAATGAPAKSIAVLPFDNLSRDPDNAYFTEGVQEEILTRLAKIADLKVISRTSTQRFKSAPGDLSQIAKQLGVMHVLEGSVQKAADQVRVNVQLINALTDEHLWADTYDRKLTDIFAVESEIAKSIADTLNAKLTGAEARAIAKHPTENPEAHELYLKGRFFWNKRTGADLKTAIQYFNQAIEKDPNYALAYAGSADAYALLPAYGAASSSESFPQAETAAKKAVELDDTLAQAHTSLAQVLLFYRLDFENASKEFERAIALDPNYATAHHWYGIGPLMSLGNFDKGLAELKRAQQLDPLSLIINADLGASFVTARRYDEAVAQLRKTIEMDPHFYYAHWNLGEALQSKGQLDEALTEYKKAAALNDDPLVLALLAQAYAKLGQRDEALKTLEQLQQIATRRYVANYIYALVYIGLGENDRAIDFLERAYHDRVGPDIAVIKVDPMLDPLRGNPRFEALVQKVIGGK
jgi:TolB-like protein/Tfp pilus assembly protein PilF